MSNFFQEKYWYGFFKIKAEAKLQMAMDSASPLSGEVLNIGNYILYLSVSVR